MIKSSLYLNTSNPSVTSDGSTTSSGVANIVNYQIEINDDGNVVLQDDSKTLTKVITNLVTTINSDNEISGTILISDDDITIDDSNSSYNEITIVISSDLAGDTAVFAMS